MTDRAPRTQWDAEHRAQVVTGERVGAFAILIVGAVLVITFRDATGWMTFIGPVLIGASLATLIPWTRPFISSVLNALASFVPSLAKRGPGGQ